MKRMHRLTTSMPPLECRSLFEAAAALDVRIGWLDLESAAAAPAEMEEAAGSGAFRFVGVTSNRVLSVKPVRGPTVLKDLLREHFSGCRLVVVRGPHDAPQLLADADGYRIRFEDGVEKRFTAEALAKALRKPRLRSSKAVEASVPSSTE